DAEDERNSPVHVEKFLVVKLPEKKPCFYLWWQEQEEQALDQRYPTDEGDHNYQRTSRPDIVREHHRQPSRQRDYSEDQHHRRVLKNGGHRLQGGLSASHHGQRGKDAVQPDQPA